MNLPTVHVPRESKLPHWNELDDRKPSYALEARNVDLLVVRYDDKDTVARTVAETPPERTTFGREHPWREPHLPSAQLGLPVRHED